MIKEWDIPESGLAFESLFLSLVNYVTMSNSIPALFTSRGKEFHLRMIKDRSLCFDCKKAHEWNGNGYYH